MTSQSSVRAGRAFVEFFLKDNTAESLKELEEKFQKTGQNMEAALAIGIPLGAATAGIGFAVQQFGELDEALRLTQGVAEGTEEDYKALAESAKLVGRTSVFTAQEVAELQVRLAKAGKTAHQITNDLVPAMQTLARATRSDLAEAGEYLVETMNAAGMSSSQAGRAIDMMVGTVNKSTIEIEDFVEAFKLFGSLGIDLEQDVDEMAAAIGVLGNFALKGSMAGTSMRRVFLNLIDPKSRKQLEDLGIEGIRAGRSFVDVIKDLQAATADTSAPERAAELYELFGARGIQAVSILAREAETSLKDLTEQAKRNGIGAKTAATANKSLGTEILLLISAAKGVVFAVGEAMAPVFLALNSVMKPVLNMTASLIDSWSFEVAVIGTIILAMTGLVAAYFAGVAALRAWLGVQKLLILLQKTWIVHLIRIKALRMAALFKSVAAAQGIWNASLAVGNSLLASMVGWFAALMKNPFVLAIAGLIGVWLWIRKIIAGKKELSDVPPPGMEKLNEKGKEVLAVAKEIAEARGVDLNVLMRQVGLLEATKKLSTLPEDSDFKKNLQERIDTLREFWREVTTEARERLGQAGGDAQTAIKQVGMERGESPGAIFGSFSARELQRNPLSRDIPLKMDDIIDILKEILAKPPVALEMG